MNLSQHREGKIISIFILRGISLKMIFEIRSKRWPPSHPHSSYSSASSFWIPLREATVTYRSQLLGNWTSALMDKAPLFRSEDCIFDSWQCRFCNAICKIPLIGAFIKVISRGNLHLSRTNIKIPSALHLGSTSQFRVVSKHWQP